MSRRQHRTHLKLDALEDRIVMDTYTVTRLSDMGKGRSVFGDLRYCITQANAVPGEDLIIFGVTGTINLTGKLPDLSDDLIIAGPGADVVTIRRDSGGDYRIFTVPGDVNVQIYSVTITNGHPNGAGTTEKDGWGGGIYNSGSLTLMDSAVVHNMASSSALQRAGGIYNEGVLSIASSLIAHNSVPDSPGTHSSSRGGGIFNKAGATLTINNSTISNNSALADGIPTSTWASGGGIENEGSGILHISNSTISANFAVRNGSPQPSGGIFGTPNSIRNTIVSGNPGGDCNCPVATNFIGGDAMLGTLADNGGPTLTHALLPGSPAIDAGDNTDAPEFDQRGTGFPRIVNGTIDIGAFEVQASGISNPPSARRGSPDPAVLLTAAFFASDENV